MENFIFCALHLMIFFTFFLMLNHQDFSDKNLSRKKNLKDWLEMGRMTFDVSHFCTKSWLPKAWLIFHLMKTNQILGSSNFVGKIKRNRGLCATLNVPNMPGNFSSLRKQTIVTAIIPAGIYMFKVKKDTKNDASEMCSKLTIKTPKRRNLF